MATETPENKIKFWAFLVGVMLAVSVVVVLIDMSIKAAILEESATLRRVILGERERQDSGNNTDNSEHHFDPVLPGDLLVPADPRMGEASSGNGHKAAPTSRRAVRQIPPGDPEVSSGDK